MPDNTALGNLAVVKMCDSFLETDKCFLESNILRTRHNSCYVSTKMTEQSKRVDLVNTQVIAMTLEKMVVLLLYDDVHVSREFARPASVMRFHE